MAAIKAKYPTVHRNRRRSSLMPHPPRQPRPSSLPARKETNTVAQAAPSLIHRAAKPVHNSQAVMLNQRYLRRHYALISAAPPLSQSARAGVFLGSAVVRDGDGGVAGCGKCSRAWRGLHGLTAERGDSAMAWLMAAAERERPLVVWVLTDRRGQVGRRDVGVNFRSGPWAVLGKRSTRPG
ncbi:hypothetical protein M0R45_005021 [Rubus argutus]|uniref:Uncharacterized protein n=1 Tax=Rubus argutus TaxID=59490 RepID=A0AAW1YLF6_RUBAR